MSIVDTIASCALSNCTIHDASFDSSIIPDAKDMTHSTRENVVVDQGQTGTCWIQSGLSFLSALAHRRGLTIRFSSTHLIYYDKIGKAHAFFVKFRQMLLAKDTQSRDRERWHLLDCPITDGGTWGMFLHLIRTHGLVPHDARLPMRQGTATSQLNQYINDYLRACALRLEELSSQGIHGTDADDLVVEAMMTIANAVKRSYGPSTKKCTLTKAAHGQDFHGTPLDLLNLIRKEWPYQVLAHAPDRTDGLYIGPATNDPAILRQDFFTVVDISVLVDACIEQLSCGIPVWVTCDVRFDFSSARGVAASGLHRTDALLGIPRKTHEKYEDEKRARMRANRIAPVHAMLITAVKLDNRNPTAWRLQNSWGSEEPQYGKGFMTVDHRWFCEHVFQVAVDSCFAAAPPTRTEAIQLLPWDVFGTVA